VGHICKFERVVPGVYIDDAPKWARQARGMEAESRGFDAFVEEEDGKVRAAGRTRGAGAPL